MAIEEVEIFIQWQDPNGGDAYLFFDCVEAVAHSMGAEYTEAPREDGSPVADHAFNLPDSVVITGVVSNTPIPSNPNVSESKDELPGGPFMFKTDIELKVPQPPPPKNAVGLASAGIGALGTALFGGPSASVWKSGTKEYVDRVEAAFSIIRFIKSSFTECRLRTPLFQYDNMQLTDVSVPEIPQDSSARTFTLTFTEALIANAKSVEAPQPSVIRAKPPAAKNAALKGAKNATEKVEKVNDSTLFKLTN